MRFSSFLFCLLALPLFPATAATPDAPKGALVIAGGQFRNDNPGWARMVGLAGGHGAPFLVFPTASGEPLASGRAAADQLNRLGAAAVVVPLAESGFDRSAKQVAHDPDWANRIRHCRGFFFVGGSQDRITAALYEPDGSMTPMLSALWEAYRNGAVIGGSSAGAAIMSATMFVDPPSPLDLLKSGSATDKTLAKGLGFIGPGWFVDQHFLVRGRIARALVGMHLSGYRRGLGIDEDTAVVVTGGRTAEIIGRSGVIVIDLGDTHWSQEHPVALEGVRLSYLAEGDRIDLTTAAVTPAATRAAETKIDPHSAGFRPGFDSDGGGTWTADMLGPGQLYLALTHALDGPADSVTGLAFGEPGVGSDPTLGFEFRLRRDNDTIGWSSSVGEDTTYTVLNVRLDVSPIRIDIRH